VAVGLTKEKPTLRTVYDGCDGWLWNGFGEETTYLVIWRGSASDVLSHKPEKNIEKLDKAAEKMFEHFPPSKKS
jgi:uncharacterized protein DUF4136